MTEPTVSNYPKPAIKAPDADFNLPLANHHVDQQALSKLPFVSARQTKSFDFENPLHNLMTLPGALSPEQRAQTDLPTNYGAQITGFGYHAGGHTSVINRIKAIWATERQNRFCQHKGKVICEDNGTIRYACRRRK